MITQREYGTRDISKTAPIVAPLLKAKKLRLAH
jgi:hypothetical protein